MKWACLTLYSFFSDNQNNQIDRKEKDPSDECGQMTALTRPFYCYRLRVHSGDQAGMSLVVQVSLRWIKQKITVVQGWINFS